MTKKQLRRQQIKENRQDLIQNLLGFYMVSEELQDRLTVKALKSTLVKVLGGYGAFYLTIARYYASIESDSDSWYYRQQARNYYNDYLDRYALEDTPEYYEAKYYRV